MRAGVNATLMILSIAKKGARAPQNYQSNRCEMTTITDLDREVYGPSRQPAGGREQLTLCPQSAQWADRGNTSLDTSGPHRMISGASANGR
jgi:hypothetical protein